MVGAAGFLANVLHAVVVSILIMGIIHSTLCCSNYNKAIMVKVEVNQLLQMMQVKCEANAEMSAGDVLAAVRDACKALGPDDQSTQCCLPRFVDEYAKSDYVHMQGLHMDRWVEGHIKVGEVRDMCLTRCVGRQKPIGWLSECLKRISNVVENMLATECRGSRANSMQQLSTVRDLLRGAEDYAERIHKFESDLENQHLTRYNLVFILRNTSKLIVSRQERSWC